MLQEQAIEIINSFIDIAKMIEKLPRLSLPQYQGASRDLAKICHKLLNATSMANMWFSNFQNFQFIGDPKIIIPEFKKLVQEYEDLKLKGKFHKLDLSCGEISTIYQNNLQYTLNRMFENNQTVNQDIQAIFNSLSTSDNLMVEFVHQHIRTRLDDFVSKINQILDNISIQEIDRLKEAEKKRWEYYTEWRNIVPQLISMNNALMDLVIKFANKTSTSIYNLFDDNDFT